MLTIKGGPPKMCSLEPPVSCWKAWEAHPWIGGQEFFFYQESHVPKQSKQTPHGEKFNALHDHSLLNWGTCEINSMQHIQWVKTYLCTVVKERQRLGRKKWDAGPGRGNRGRGTTEEKRRGVPWAASWCFQDPRVGVPGKPESLWGHILLLFITSVCNHRA